MFCSFKSSNNNSHILSLLVLTLLSYPCSTKAMEVEYKDPRGIKRPHDDVGSSYDASENSANGKRLKITHDPQLIFQYCDQESLRQLQESVSHLEDETLENEAKDKIKFFADQGHIEAHYVLGCMYLKDHCVDQDGKQAIYYLQPIADYGCPMAQYVLGIMYSTGEGVKQDKRKAFRYLKLAADKENIDAQRTLGFMYFNGEGIEQDMKEAFRYLKLAADKGHAKAQYTLGLMYEEGEGPEEDVEEAKKYYKLAANQGDIEAQYNLAILFHDGTAEETMEAIRLFRLLISNQTQYAQTSSEYLLDIVNPTFIGEDSAY